MSNGMSFALVYLPARFLYRLLDFFRHWYGEGSRAIGHAYISQLTEMDRTWALRVTLGHFFEPLYGDYTMVGRILGVIFRTGRVGIAGVIYLGLSLIFGAVYLTWVGLPVYVLYQIYRNL